MRGSAFIVGAALLLAGCGGDAHTFRIGVLTDCRGAFRGYDESELAAAQLPLLRRGARPAGRVPAAGVTPVEVAGRKVELVRGCNELAESAVYIDEARRLIEDEHVDVLIGAAPIASRDLARRYPDVPFIATFWQEQDTTLRSSAPNLYRFVPDFGQMVAGLGAYAYNELGWRRATILAGDQPGGWGPAAAFTAEFCALGGTIDREVLRDPYAPRPPAELAKAARVPGSDGIAVLLTLFDAVTPVTGALLDKLDDPARRLVLSDQALYDPGFLPTLGRRLDRVALTARVPAGPPSRALADYAKRFRAAFPRLGPGFEYVPFVTEFSDAVEASLAALERAGGDLSDGRARLREELGRSRLELPLGTVHLDANRQVVEDVSLAAIRRHGGRTVLEPLSVAKDVEQTYGGLLSKAPPPGPRSQPCRKATPPPWAK